MSMSGKRVALISFCALALLLRGGAVDGIASDWQFWPEASWHFPLKEGSQLTLVARITQDDGTQEQDLQLGPSLTFDLDTFRASYAQTAEERDRTYLTLGVGYRYIRSEDLTEDPTVEHRGIVELTPRWYLPHGITVSDRNRVDLRWIEGDRYSTRYRNRLHVQRNFHMRRLAFTGYAEIEAFNDSRHEGWERVRYGIGIELPLRGLLIRSGLIHGKGSVLKVYYIYQDERRHLDTSLNAVGVTYKMYY
jgi:hypothetical protein